MTRCPNCAALNDAAAIACRTCDRELPYREAPSPRWQRTLGWVMVWVSFATAFVYSELNGLAFLTNAAGWVLFLEDDWVLRVLLGAVIAVVMCQLALALGARFSPLLGPK
jgi:hypothetical protein